jgi:diphosphomevalonate decarboxylase
MTADTLFCETGIARGAASQDTDTVTVDGSRVPPERTAPFFAAIRAALALSDPFTVEATSNFPQAAGLASSSALFAAMAFGCAALVGRSHEAALVSALARLGSASAARAVFGGFSSLAAGATSARPEFSRDHWPELRMLAVIVASGPKPIASRDAMGAVAATSPYYAAWLEDAPRTYAEIRAALAVCDLQRLGEQMQLSYLRMFGTMLSAAPPINYLLPGSVHVQQVLRELRAAGVAAWETMDAGPQVKVFTTAAALPSVRAAIEAAGFAPERIVTCRAGAGARCVDG